MDDKQLGRRKLELEVKTLEFDLKEKERESELKLKKMQNDIEFQRQSNIRKTVQLYLYAFGIFAALIVAWSRLPL